MATSVASPIRPPLTPLDAAWYDRSAIEVAPLLLGCLLVHESAEGRVAGRIVEVEAYLGPEDLAAHSARGRTARNAAMFGPPGHAYVYLVYGLHHCLNVVCGPGEKPEAVLLRSAVVTEGLDLARRRRGPLADGRLAAGPGNLARAFGIDRAHNGLPLVGGRLRIEPAPVPARARRTARIGVAYAGGWADRPLRFVLAGDSPASHG